MFNFFGSLFNQQKHAWCWWHLPSWWLNQPIWKIWYSQIGSSPEGSGQKFKKKEWFTTTSCSLQFLDPGFWLAKIRHFFPSFWGNKQQTTQGRGGPQNVTISSNKALENIHSKRALETIGGYYSSISLFVLEILVAKNSIHRAESSKIT